MVEGDGLENRYTLTGIEGSNPSLSAIFIYYLAFSQFIKQPAAVRRHTADASCSSR